MYSQLDKASETKELLSIGSRLLKKIEQSFKYTVLYFDRTPEH